MQSWERYIVYSLCAIAIIITLCAVSWNISADKSGFVVGILAVLVTLLVGWQIYNAIGMQEIIKNYDILQRDFTKANEALRAQDERNIILIDAFAKYYEAGKEKDSYATKYRILIEALNLFLKSNVPIGYHYIVETRTDLHAVLDSLESKAHSFDKKHLVDIDSTIESAHEMLRDTIKARKEELDFLIKEIKSLRDRRRDLVKRFKEENKQVQNPRT